MEWCWECAQSRQLRAQAARQSVYSQCLHSEQTEQTSLIQHAESQHLQSQGRSVGRRQMLWQLRRSRVPASIYTSALPHINCYVSKGSRLLITIRDFQTQISTDRKEEMWSALQCLHVIEMYSAQWGEGWTAVIRKSDSHSNKYFPCSDPPSLWSVNEEGQTAEIIEINRFRYWLHLHPPASSS